MWRQPRTILGSITAEAWLIATTKEIWKRPFATTSPTISRERAWKIFHLLYNEQVVTLNRIDPSRRRQRSVNPTYASLITSQIMRLVQRVETEDYRILVELYEAMYDIARQTSLNGPSPETHMAKLYVEATHMLIGEERKYLVGVRNNRPAWKRLNSPLIGRANNGPMVTVEMAFIDQKDVDLVPYPDEWASDTANAPYPDIPFEAVTDLLEKAYYSQRYVVRSEGAYVRITGYPKIVSLELRVRPGVNDPHYIDFLARFELNSGSYFMVLDGLLGTGQSRPASEQLSYDRFFAYVVAQIYHDLVTAKEIRIASNASCQKPVNPTLRHEPSWIYIPRTRHIQTSSASPREPMEQPRISKPHHVTVYPRKGMMTKSHRKEIEEWEEKHKLKIMHIADDDQTIVLPHISPKSSTIDVASLPCFVKARLQREIDAIAQRPDRSPKGHVDKMTD